MHAERAREREPAHARERERQRDRFGLTFNAFSKRDCESTRAREGQTWSREGQTWSREGQTWFRSDIDLILKVYGHTHTQHPNTHTHMSALAS